MQAERGGKKNADESSGPLGLSPGFSRAWLNRCSHFPSEHQNLQGTESIFFFFSERLSRLPISLWIHSNTTIKAQMCPPPPPPHPEQPSLWPVEKQKCPHTPVWHSAICMLCLWSPSTKSQCRLSEQITPLTQVVCWTGCTLKCVKAQKSQYIQARKKKLELSFHMVNGCYSAVRMKFYLWFVFFSNSKVARSKFRCCRYCSWWSRSTDFHAKVSDARCRFVVLQACVLSETSESFISCADLHLLRCHSDLYSGS